MHEVVQFLILVCTNNWQRGIEPLCISISILARFWEAWYSYSVTKGFRDCKYISCYITTHVWELGFRYLGDARYSFSLWKMGEWAFHFQHLHIFVFVWVWCITHLFLYLCFWFLAFNFIVVVWKFSC